MDNKKICAFLDLLGFSNYTLTDTAGALNLLKDYRTILNQKVTDNKLHPAESYPPELQKPVEKCLVDSFEYFLPFSDSIFIVSSEPNKFIRQLSCFLLECFKFSTSHLHTFSTNKEEPTVVEKSARKEHWYPLLFRGGVSFEEVIPIDLSSIVEKELMKIKNLTGRAIVQAVALEKLDKGLRVFCEPAFCKSLDPDVKHLIAPHEGGEHYEILWPAIEYIESNDCHSEPSNKFDLLFKDAVIFWNRFNHAEYGIHYYKFLKLIVRAALEFFELTGHLREARCHISGVINEVGLELKRTDLMDSQFI